MSTIPLTEIARWLARCSGITPDRVPSIKAYVTHFLSKKAYKPAAIEGQQQMKKAVTRAAKHARTKASVTMVTVDQLDRELAAARPPSPPPAAPAELAGTPQPDPRPPPDPYTDVPMADIENIDNWVPSP
jgi:hypothetical protein